MNCLASRIENKHANVIQWFYNIIWWLHHNFLYHLFVIYMFMVWILNPKSIINLTQIPMLYDTYGEEYLTFLQDLNEILSLNELVELDYM